jgi:hypothetical protein
MVDGFIFLAAKIALYTVLHVVTLHVVRRPTAI